MSYGKLLTTILTENSDVLPALSVAVAEMMVPAGTGSNSAVNSPCLSGPVASRNIAPLPRPDGSASGVGTGLA